MITHEELVKIIHYDSNTGICTRIKSRHSSAVGKIAKSKNPRGYITMQILGAPYTVHRLAWLYVYKVWPADQIDHIDGNKENNKIENLRILTNSQNQQNKYIGRGASKYLGVTFSKDTKKQWRASIRLNNKFYYIGRFYTEEEAYKAYLEKKRILHPFAEIAKLK